MVLTFLISLLHVHMLTINLHLHLTPSSFIPDTESAPRVPDVYHVKTFGFLIPELLQVNSSTADNSRDSHGPDS